MSIIINCDCSIRRFLATFGVRQSVTWGFGDDECLRSWQNSAIEWPLRVVMLITPQGYPPQPKRTALAEMNALSTVYVSTCYGSSLYHWFGLFWFTIFLPGSDHCEAAAFPTTSTSESGQTDSGVPLSWVKRDVHNPERGLRKIFREIPSLCSSNSNDLFTKSSKTMN